MKKVFLFAAVAAMFAACSSNNDLSVANNQPAAAAGDDAVSFEVYTNRANTRSGKAADLTTAVMKGTGDAVGDGFGVFAYYTDNNDYDQLAIPNFMWNQQVKAKFESANPSAAFLGWEYSPVKYWPNEYGNNAISDDNDKVTFFAYAPYVDAGTDGKAANQTYGITQMTRNTTAGDPIVKYIGSFDATKAVDLCWGVCNQSDWQLVQTGQVQSNLTIGKPWINVQRPAGVDQKLKFQFRHATAKMKIDINEFNDGYVPAADEASDRKKAETRIWIRSVRFTGFTMRGALNLNNETSNKPYWMNYNGIGDLVADEDVIVYDQRKDGKEGVAGAEATNEKVGGLNEKFIQKEDLITAGAWKDDRLGVDKDATSLFQNGGIFYVIPTGDKMQIEIVYDVETISPTLGTTLSDVATPGSSIENRISKTIEFGNGVNTLEAGKAYDIHLHLGMNSVKFDAAVVDWDEMAAPDIDLPANMPAYQATTTTGKLDIPGADTKFVFAVYGMKGGESVTADVSSITSANAKVSSTGNFTAPDNRANASGVVYVEVSGFNANTTIADLAAKDITVTGALTAATTIAVTQKAQPLALREMATTDNKTFTIKVTRNDAAADLKNHLGTVTSIPSYATPAAETDKIKVWCDGALLNIVTTTPTDEKSVKVDWAEGTLTFNTARTVDSVIKVYIEAGNVPGETLSHKVVTP